MASFLAFLRPTDHGRFAVEFPDLPGCTVEGLNLVETVGLAGDELVRHLSLLLSFGEDAPLPSSEEQLAQDARRRGADLIAFEVDLDVVGIAHPLIVHTL